MSAGGPAMPGSYDLEIYRGDTGRWGFLLWQDTAKTVPVNLTGATAAAQMRTVPGGSVLADFTCTCAVTAINRVDMVLAPTVSAALNPSRGWWDLQITYPSGDVMTVLAGRACVIADVTSVAA